MHPLEELVVVQHGLHVLQRPQQLVKFPAEWREPESLKWKTATNCNHFPCVYYLNKIAYFVYPLHFFS